MGTHLQSLKSNLQSIRVCVRTMLRLQSSLIRLQPALFQQSTCLASLHTSAALDTKRHIVLQRRRRKRLRLKKLNNRFADVTEGQREMMVRWFKEGKLYSVMGHDELVDYNLNTPIQVAPDKLQPKCWYMDEKTPRHSHQIHFSDDIKKRAPEFKLNQNQLESGNDEIIDEINSKFASTDLNDAKTEKNN